jgi:DNA repair protein RadB
MNPPNEAVADRQTTGSLPIDKLLEGGLERDGLTQVYGEGGTGKSILALSAAIAVSQSDRWVFYIDTEGVSVDRLAAMSGTEPERILRRFLLSSPKEAHEQETAVRTACALVREGRRPVGLIVLDSATMYYRLTLNTPEEDDARSQLLSELADLLAMAIAEHVPVLLSNQVYRNIGTGALEPIGGPFVNHVSKTIIRMDRLSGDRRRAVLVKHRSLPEREALVRITARGLE